MSYTSKTQKNFYAVDSQQLQMKRGSQPLKKSPYKVVVYSALSALATPLD